MADAGGSFVTRSFEKLLKDSTYKKHPKLQDALKAYLERPKVKVLVEQPATEIPSKSHGETEEQEIQEESPTPADGSAYQQQSLIQINAAATMAEAGHSLEGNEADAVIIPIRLAIETKQSKLIETSLDCLHKLIAYGHLEGEAGIEGGRNSILLTDLLQLVCSCADNTAVDSVVLQVIKVVLTAVASSTFKVHGECLVLGIRTCYNIVLNSKNQANLTTAKATLTQVINIVFKRMEAAELGQEEIQVVRQYTRIEHPFSAALDRVNVGDSSGSFQPPQSISSEPEVVSQETNEPATPGKMSVEEIQTLAGESNIKGLEAALDHAVGPTGNSGTGINLETLVMGQRDALLVFRTLCKLAMKEGSEDLILRTKILSLELIQGLLNSVSREFTVNFAFIDSIKTYLCYALVRAYVSTVDKVFQLACNIFAVLILRFRESLKAEIGLFFPLVVLRSLDSVDSPLSQRITVLKMLEGVTYDPQMLADVFVNYDCDLEATNLFERMVNSLSRISQGMPNGDPNSIVLAQNSVLNQSSLQCLVNVLSSLASWSRKDKASQHTVVKTGSIEEGTEASKEDDGKDVSVESQADVFGKAKAHKATIEAAVAQFNLKPERGISFLESHNLVKREPAAIAAFLKNTPGLSKTLVGDYLGEFDDFHVATMHAYVDSMDFQGLKFDGAIREFLKGFRLPGEAQKIDRIMEKFAERYCRDNPGIFKTADTAYVLAYAIIMLNTDAHNPVVTSKMTKADFVRINSGLDGEDAAPVPLLEEIYDSIVHKEIKLKEDGGGEEEEGKKESFSVVAVLNLATPRKRSVTDTKLESQEIVLRTQKLVKSSQGAKRGLFHTASHAELARPMLEAVGWPLLAAFAVTMEDSDSRPRVTLCMDGFRLGIHLTKQLGMDTMRYAFLTSLVRFTFLHAPKDLRSKNVEALKTLLGLAEHEPDSLQDTWNAILECISRLEHITSSPGLAATLLANGNQPSREAVLSGLQELVGKPTEQVFSNSQHLPSDQVVEFFTALCGVSGEELRQMPARVYSLQKLVEISYYNMGRIRMVWGRIWAVLSIHFVSAGGHHDQKIAMYAIDSLRQLAIKYLERAELANFTFQNDILKPFVVIMRTSKNGQIRELIVQCIVQMMSTKVASIKSGWRCVFMVLTTAAGDPIASIVEKAFTNVEIVVLEHFEQVVGDCFMDCVNCLIAFANNKVSPRISLKAIALLRICEERLADGSIPGGASRPVVGDDLSADLSGANSDVAEFYWFPMLAGLSELASDPRLEVRSASVGVLFDLLKERGHKFSPPFWASVFERVLFPLFDYVRHAGSDGGQPGSADDWLLETAIASLHMLADLFCCFYSAVSFVLPSLLGLLLDCATRTDQSLAAISVGALQRLVDSGGGQFSQEDWALVLDTIRQASVASRPTEILIHSSRKEKLEEGKNKSQESSLVAMAGMPKGNEAAYLFDRTVSTQEPPPAANAGEEEEEEEEEEGKEEGLEEETKEGREGEEDLTKGDSAAEMPVLDAAPPTSESMADSLFSTGGLFGGNSLGKNLIDTFFSRTMSQKTLPAQTAVDMVAIKEKANIADTVEVEAGVELQAAAAAAAAEDEGGAEEVGEEIRTKCYVQLLIVRILDQLQTKHWSRLGADHRRQVLDLAKSLVDFASAYNSDKSYRARMVEDLEDRPPFSLIRQEVAATQLYLTLLLRTLKDPVVKSLPAAIADSIPVETGELVKKFVMAKPKSLPPLVQREVKPIDQEIDEQLQAEAKERLLLFCKYVLDSSAKLQSVNGETVDLGIHQSLTLRAAVVAKVLTVLTVMNAALFNIFLAELYPYFTRLICSEQMEVRTALGKLIKSRFVPRLTGSS